VAETKINIALDPSSVVASIRAMGAESKALADQLEAALGKKAVEAVDKLEENAEKGSTRISNFFRTMGQRVREDLRTAFDASGVLAGAKFAKEIGEGVKSVFEMERAFDRLNTRLMLTGRAFLDFKRNVGNAAADTGQKLEDVLPGVETAAARGRVRDPLQLQNIARTLGQARATTGEDVDPLAETVVDILRNQGQTVNDRNFRATIDALQAARVEGAFGSAAEAGAAVEAISPYAQRLNMDTRQMAGAAAMASRAGPGGQAILQQLIERAAQPGGQEQLNAVLGQQIFRNGRLDTGALGQIDVNRFGQYSQQAMAEATGLQGASGADLARFVESFRMGMVSIDRVTKGSNETANQFTVATDNFASKVDRFRQRTIEAARQIGSGLSDMTHALSEGDLGRAGRGAMAAGQAAWDNSGTLAAAAGVTAVVGLLAGGGINRILSRLPGAGTAGGLAAGVTVGQALRQAGVTPVYVVNAADIARGIGGLPGLADTAASVATTGGIAGSIGTAGAAGAAGRLAGAARGLGIAGLAYGAGQAGVAASEYVASNTGVNARNEHAWIKENVGEVAAAIHAALANTMAGASNMVFGTNYDTDYYSKGHGGYTPSAEEIARAVKEGASQATLKLEGPLTNPSDVLPRGGSF
jgi:hypothetical protein